MRVVLLAFMVLAGASCRNYDNYSPLAGQDGLLDADKFARLGREQAQLVAIGRSLAAWKQEDPSRAAAEVVRYAEQRMPDVVSIQPDPAGYRLEVAFRSGWRTAAIPIEDGVHPDSTRNLPPAR